MPALFLGLTLGLLSGGLSLLAYAGIEAALDGWDRWLALAAAAGALALAGSVAAMRAP